MKILKIGPDGSLPRITSSFKDITHNIKIVKVPDDEVKESEPLYKLVWVGPEESESEESEKSDTEWWSDSEEDAQLPVDDKEKTKTADHRTEDKTDQYKNKQPFRRYNNNKNNRYRNPRNLNNYYSRRNNFNNSDRRHREHELSTSDKCHREYELSTSDRHHREHELSTDRHHREHELSTDRHHREHELSTSDRRHREHEFTSDRRHREPELTTSDRRHREYESTSTSNPGESNYKGYPNKRNYGGSNNFRNNYPRPKSFDNVEPWSKPHIGINGPPTYQHPYESIPHILPLNQTPPISNADKSRGLLGSSPYSPNPNFGDSSSQGYWNNEYPVNDYPRPGPGHAPLPIQPHPKNNFYKRNRWPDRNNQNRQNYPFHKKMKNSNHYDYRN